MPADEIPREITSLLCDDVRQELGNKLSLMGVYGDSIIVPEVPAVLPRLFLFKSFQGGQGDYKIVLDLITLDKTSVFQEVVLKDFGTVTANSGWNGVLGVAPVRLDKVGEYKALVTLIGAKDSVSHVYAHPFTVTSAK